MLLDQPPRQPRSKQRVTGGHRFDADDQPLRRSWTPWLDEFFVVTLPFMLIGIIGGLILGIALLRRGFRPRATAVLLTLWLPLFFVLSAVIALGAALLPALWAWAIAGWSLASTSDEAPVEELTPVRA